MNRDIHIFLFINESWDKKKSPIIYINKLTISVIDLSIYKLHNFLNNRIIWGIGLMSF